MADWFALHVHLQAVFFCKVVSALAPFQAQKQSTEILVSTLEAEHAAHSHLLGEKLQPAVHFQLAQLDIA